MKRNIYDNDPMMDLNEYNKSEGMDLNIVSTTNYLGYRNSP